jgi:hypothetical protein
VGRALDAPGPALTQSGAGGAPGEVAQGGAGMQQALGNTLANRVLGAEPVAAPSRERQRGATEGPAAGATSTPAARTAAPGGGRRKPAAGMRTPSAAAAASAPVTPVEAPAELMPEGGEAVNAVGVVNWDGKPEVPLRSAPDTEGDNVLRSLPFNARVQVIKRFPGNWLFVSTEDGDVGYVFAARIWTHLPEPNATLHRVESGIPGTAIAIAERYFQKYADDWGQDLRFYVNVLAWVNRVRVSDTVGGWKGVHFQAGRLIWIPSYTFARSLRGVVNSGSISYEVLDAIGLAGFIERMGELWGDFKDAISLSRNHLGEAIRRHVEEALRNALIALAMMLVIAVGVLAVTTAIGAAIGALLGGVGAAPGAAVGFKVGMALLEWLGLAMLVIWIGTAIGETAAAFGTFLARVWNARGNREVVEVASRDFAEAVGVLIGHLVEAIVLFAASVGIGAAIGKIGGTRFGRAIHGRMREWLTRRSSGEARAPVERAKPQQRKPTEERPARGGEESAARPGERRAQEREGQRQRERESGRAEERGPERGKTEEDVHLDDHARSKGKGRERDVDPALCFAVGTPVWTPAGARPIEALRPGDEVLAFDADAKAVVAREVLDLTRGETASWVLVRVDGAELRTTRMHPFWVPSRHEWLAADQLEAGMALLSRDGATVKIAGVDVQWLETREVTYNLSVDELESFFIGAAAVLVHNITASRIKRLQRVGYRNYVLRNRRGRIYYSGMFGPDTKLSDVIRRHRKKGNRFNPKLGDRLELRPGTRTYGDSRLLEHRVAVRNGTIIGRKGDNYRGNRQRPLQAEVLTEYLEYEQWKQGCG